MSLKGMKLQLLGIAILLIGIIAYLLYYGTYKGQVVMLCSTAIGSLLSIIGFFQKDNNDN